MIIPKLAQIQQTLVCNKGQWNKFGKYPYRSCEDILNAVKPHLKSLNAYLVLSDELVHVGERYYIKATARIIDCDDNDAFEVTAYAREEEEKKGMDGSQVTGAASSYARKYALNGLFGIDDVKDYDATNDHGKGNTAEKPSNAEKSAKNEKGDNASPNQIKVISGYPEATRAWILKQYKIDALEELRVKDATEIIKTVSAKEKEKEAKQNA